MYYNIIMQKSTSAQKKNPSAIIAAVCKFLYHVLHYRLSAGIGGESTGMHRHLDVARALRCDLHTAFKYSAGTIFK